MSLENAQILIDPSEHQHRNIGDAAMLIVAVRRLLDLAPRGRVRVVTEDPQALRAICPQAYPVSARGRRVWTQPFLPVTPGRLRRFERSMTRAARRRFPNAMRRIARARLMAGHGQPRDLDDYLMAASMSDCVLLSGMGALTDDFVDHAWGLLTTLETAMEAGAVTAMMGQGIGPVHDEQLRSRLRSVLPRVDVIALREPLLGPRLLEEFGVTADRIMVTGDDAIEIAYDARPETPGGNVGVNVRMAPYSAVDEDMTRLVAGGVTSFTSQRRVEIVPLPVSHYAGSNDMHAITRMFGRSEEGSPIVSLDQLLSQTGSCRIVISGSYHAAVFALSMGIPVVAIAGSNYYLAKFAGLAAQFPEGCEVVDLRAANPQRLLLSAMESSWERADEVRENLLRAARDQIALSRAAYRRLGGIMAERKGTAFNLSNQDEPAWHDRAKLCADLLDSLGAMLGKKLRVADIGCGDMKLQDAIHPHAFSYEGFDILPQRPEVTRYDVEAGPLPRQFDVAIMLGVIEYLSDPEATMARLSSEVPYLVFSHSVRPRSATTSSNLRWSSQLTAEELDALIRRIGLEVLDVRAGATHPSMRLWLCKSAPRPAVMTAP